ncbi:matrilysin-like [Episyrphus balteatus]|uniref:matrilysin-like n=1 Tax=Episyrphus balteatus TaxID=286459 RepID=UPI002486A658|nr:matrilysin-like [Episyrphus balteatus]
MFCPNVLISFATLLLLTVVGIHSAPVQTQSEAQKYLSKFGYLQENAESLQMIDENTVIQAIQDFQEFFGLDLTGLLDSNTLEFMSLTRCGNKDKRGNSGSIRSYGFGTPWSKKDLTYKITQYTRKMDRPDVDAEIARAFNVWSQQTDLRFTPKSNGPVDIEIKFVQGNHGDRNSFDGPNGVLAHAYSPEDGDAHFDDTEQWTINTPYGKNLFQVAAHEFGHSLGLDHSSVQESLMYPTYKRYDPYFRLHSNDITRIQELYGRKTEQENDAEKEDNSNNGYGFRRPTSRRNGQNPTVPTTRHNDENPGWPTSRRNDENPYWPTTRRRNDENTEENEEDSKVDTTRGKNNNNCEEDNDEYLLAGGSRSPNSCFYRTNRLPTRTRGKNMWKTGSKV